MNVVGATPIPSVDNLPTHSVYDVDKQDPKGWTYCYAFGHDTTPGDNFYSLFSGSLFEQLRLNCSRKGAAVAPLVVVDAAAFLLDETTSYIDNTKTEDSNNMRSRSTDAPQTPTDVLVDPIQSASKSSNVEKSASSEEARTKPSTTSKLAQSILPTTTSQTSPDQSLTDNEPAQNTEPASRFKEPSVTETAGQPPAQDTVGSNSASQQSSMVNAGAQSGSKAAVATQAIGASSGVQIDTLNSLMQDIGELQSSSDRGAVASFAGLSTQASMSPPNKATTTASILLPPIIIGTSTASVNSDGNFMIGTHALQPTDSPYVLQGTTYALDSSKTALVVNGVSTHAVDTAQHVSDVPQAATLTINGVIVTPDPASNYIVETQTLKPGGPAIMMSGTRISLASGAAAVVVGSETSVLSAIMSTHAVGPAHHTSDNPQPATLTINGITVTANSASNYVVETQTLKPGGPAITVSGTRISLASNAATVVVGSQTSALSEPSKTMGTGDYVWSGLAGILSAASESASSLSSTADKESAAGSVSASLFTNPSETASLSTQDGFLLPTAVENETTIDESSASPFTLTNPSSTGPSSTGRAPTQQTPTPSTDLGTLSQSGPNALSSPSSSPTSSSSIETSPENNSGRVIVNSSFAICVLSLVVAIVAREGLYFLVSQ
jgi:uncharacterized protein YodC (DUF2158 family)